MATNSEERMCIRCFKHFTPDLVLTDAENRDWCKPCAKWVLSKTNVSQSVLWNDPEETDPIHADNAS